MPTPRGRPARSSTPSPPSSPSSAAPTCRRRSASPGSSTATACSGVGPEPARRRRLPVPGASCERAPRRPGGRRQRRHRAPCGPSTSWAPPGARRDAVLVTLGTGIGGGQSPAASLQRGANGFAGEPGHMVVDPRGPGLPVRPAGLLGAVRVGLGPRPARPRRRRGRPAPPGRRAGRRRPRGGAGRARHGGGAARATPARSPSCASSAWWVALGVANLVNVSTPRSSSIGGGLAEAGELLLEPGARALRRPRPGRPSTARRCGSSPPSSASGPARSAPRSCARASSLRGPG